MTYLFGSEQYDSSNRPAPEASETEKTYSEEVREIAEQYLTELTSPNISYIEELWKEGRL